MTLSSVSTIAVASLAALAVGGASTKIWGFRPAHFGGLQLGLSSRADCLKKFGKPVYVGQPEGEPDLVLDTYGPLPSAVSLPHRRVLLKFDKRTQRLVHVEVHCTRDFTVKQLQEVLGNDWRVTYWDFDQCLSRGDGISGPLFEREKGPVEFLENRPLGLSYHHDSRTLEFLSAPIGPGKSRCVGLRPKQPGSK